MYDVYVSRYGPRIPVPNGVEKERKGCVSRWVTPLEIPSRLKERQGAHRSILTSIWGCGDNRYQGPGVGMKGTTPSTPPPPSPL